MTHVIPVETVNAPAPALGVGIPASAHLIGIGGAGMRGLAKALLVRGVRVSGSDAGGVGKCADLVAMGAAVHGNHVAENVGDVAAVIWSTAIAPTNPEMVEARRRGIPLLHRADLLAAFLAQQPTVLVAGTHGKTTTSAMMTLLLESAGMDPLAFVGGEVTEFGGNVRPGRGGIGVAESDESDGSFLKLPGRHAIITNIEAEHMNYWETEERLFSGFHEFARKTREGCLVLCLDDPGIQRLAPRLEFPFTSYSTRSNGTDYWAEDIQLAGDGSRFTLRSLRGQGVAVELGVPGIHNVSNATAAYAMAARLGADIGALGRALKLFRGVGRRFTTMETSGGVMVIDDYAHHVTEIRATIQAALLRRQERGGRLIAVFQPHRHTRTQYFRDLYPGAFEGSDRVIITEIYGAGEEPIPGLSGEVLAHEVGVKNGLDVVFRADPYDAGKCALDGARTGDIVLFLGAGSISDAARKLAKG